MYNTYEESILTALSSGRKFLDNSEGFDVLTGKIEYYLPLAHINKVIKLLKFKSRQRNSALSIAPPIRNTAKCFCNFVNRYTPMARNILPVN